MNTTDVDVEEPLWINEHTAPMLMALFIYKGYPFSSTNETNQGEPWFVL